MAFLVTAIVTMAPAEEEMREDAALMERIAELSNSLGEGQRRQPRAASAENREPGGRRARPSGVSSLSDAGAAP